MRPTAPTLLLLPLLLALVLPGASKAQVRVITEADGTVRLTNRPASDRAPARVVMEEGVMRVTLRSGARVVPQADRGQHDQAFAAAAARWDLSVDLIKAVARVESAFDPRAVSPVGARGLMQLMPETGRAMGVTDFFDPVQSIQGGARYLRKMLNRFGELEHALAAYNAGPTAVTRYGGIPPFEETRRYVKRVLAMLEPTDVAPSRQPES